MSGREHPRRNDPDDWFGDLDPAISEANETNAVGGPHQKTEESGAADHWLAGEAVPTRLRRDSADFTITLRTLLAAGAIVVATLTIAALALAGVFSHGAKHPASIPPTTVVSTTAHTPTTTRITTASQPRTAISAPNTTLKAGDQGPQVKRLQRVLKLFGYTRGAADGIYGPSTQAAVKRFQQASGLSADGLVGPATLQALERDIRSSS